MFYIDPHLNLVTHRESTCLKAVISSDGLLNVYFESFNICFSIYNMHKGIVVTCEEQHISSSCHEDKHNIDSYNLVFNGQNKLEIVNFRLSTIQMYFNMRKVECGNKQKEFTRRLQECA